MSFAPTTPSVVTPQLAPPIPTQQSPIVSAAEMALERSRGQALLGLTVTTTIFAIITCGIRFWVRRRMSSGIWWDDYSVIVGMIMGFVGMVFTAVEATSVNDRIKAMEYDYLSQPLLMFGTTLGKISICFFFLRTVGRRRPWNLLLGLLTVILTIVNLVFALISNLQCRPLEKLWRPTVNGQCFNPQISLNLYYIQGGFGVFTYFFLAIFPIMIVRDANVVRSARWPFYSLAGCMTVAAVFSIVRAYETSVIGPAPAPFSADVLLATLFAVLVQNLTIGAANILPLGPLFDPRARDLSLLVATVDDEEAAQRAASKEAGGVVPVAANMRGGVGAGGEYSSSDDEDETLKKRSSFISVKRQTTLIIEGPRKSVDKPLPPTRLARHVSFALPEEPDTDNNNTRNQQQQQQQQQQPQWPAGPLRAHPPMPRLAPRSTSDDVPTSRPGTSHGLGVEVTADGGQGRDNIVAMHLDEAEAKNYEGWDMDAFNNGILRTVSVQVVEEDITEAELDEARLASSNRNWKHLLRDGPQYQRGS